MNYIDFKELKEKPVGQSCYQLDFPAGVEYSPLDFTKGFNHVMKLLDDYAGYDDVRDFNYEIDSFMDGFRAKFPDYEPLAIQDLAILRGDDDNYANFVIFVDIASPDFRVLYLNPEFHDFPELFPSFAEFYSALAPYDKTEY